MKEMIKNRVTVVRSAVAGVALTTSFLLCSVPAFAADGTVDPVAVLTTSCTTMAASITSAIGAVIPIALPLVGISLVVTIGLKVFKSITRKA